MQVMFLRQHFGYLAIGLSTADEKMKDRIDFLDMAETNDIDLNRFFQVSFGGVTHPWTQQEYEPRVAISCSGLVVSGDSIFASSARIFAKVELFNSEIYLAYRRPHQVIAWGLPCPTMMADEIVQIAREQLNGESHQDEVNWDVVDKRQVPVYHRSILGKVISRVLGAVKQDSTFFLDWKSR